MRVREQCIHEFARLYEIEFGERLPPEEAAAKVTRLVELYLSILRPLPEKATSPSDPPSSHTARAGA